MAFRIPLEFGTRFFFFPSRYSVFHLTPWCPFMAFRSNLANHEPVIVENPPAAHTHGKEWQGMAIEGTPHGAHRYALINILNHPKATGPSFARVLLLQVTVNMNFALQRASLEETGESLRIFLCSFCFTACYLSPFSQVFCRCKSYTFGMFYMHGDGMKMII